MAMNDLGSLFVGIGLLAAIISIVALFLGDRMGAKDGDSVTNAGYMATFAIAGFMTLAIVILSVAFLQENLTFKYVAENRPNITGTWAWLYRIAAVWAGREGSVLFWEWCLSLFAAFVAWKRMEFTDRVSNLALGVTNIVQAMFSILLLTAANTPFAKVLIQGTIAYDPVTGQGLFDTATQAMNPLLQTWAMVLHPPTLFIGYAGLTIPFAYAVAALIANDPSKKWVEHSDRITVFSWLLLGIGIGLGAVWAYYELAFGGFWAWDPVENASFLPWLTGVGLVHSMTMYRKRGAAKGWTITLAAVTFAMVILGTFITRAGILSQDASVHAFGGEAWSRYIFLTMIIGSLVAGVGGWIMRRQTFASVDEFEGMAAREVAYEANNIIMLMAALLLTYMTLSSIMPAWLPAGGKVIGRETYDAIARPIGIGYIMLMVVCPVLSWRKTGGAEFWNRIKWPLAMSAALSLALIALWSTKLYPTFQRLTAAGLTTPGAFAAGPLAIVGFIVAAMAICLPIWLFIDGTRKRAAARGIGMGTAFVEILTKARTQSGGYLTHLGMGIILLGLVGATLFVDNGQQNFLAKGGQEKLTVGGYTFTLEGLDRTTRPNGDIADTARLKMLEPGGGSRIVAPSQVAPKQIQDQTNDPNQGRKEVSIIHKPLYDVFVTLQSTQNGLVGVDVKIFPLISMAWGGFALLTIGSLLASWPKRRQPAVAEAPAQTKRGSKGTK